MKIAVVSSPIRGETDRLISEAAEQMKTRGAILAGVVKVLEPSNPNSHDCDMDLRVLPNGPEIRITQSLGEGALGCRLDPGGIAEAVATVEHSDTGVADLFILNKFGPQEAEGRGFCGAIGTALEQGIPVLVGVGSNCREAFEAFADGLAENLPPDAEAIHSWCQTAMAEANE